MKINSNFINFVPTSRSLLIILLLHLSLFLTAKRPLSQPLRQFLSTVLCIRKYCFLQIFKRLFMLPPTTVRVSRTLRFLRLFLSSTTRYLAVKHLYKASVRARARLQHKPTLLIFSPQPLTFVVLQL